MPLGESVFICLFVLYLFCFAVESIKQETPSRYRNGQEARPNEKEVELTWTFRRKRCYGFCGGGGGGGGEIQAETDSGKKKDREPLDNFKYGGEKVRQMSTQMSEDYQTPPEEI